MRAAGASAMMDIEDVCQVGGVNFHHWLWFAVPPASKDVGQGCPDKQAQLHVSGLTCDYYCSKIDDRQTTGCMLLSSTIASDMPETEKNSFIM